MSRPSRLTACVTAAAAFALAAPATAAAHGLVGKQDLPIPRWLFAWAASAVLVVSFVGLAVSWPRPRLQAVTERLRFGLPRLLDVLCGALGVAAFAFVIYAGFAGAQSAQTNVLPTVVYVLFWVGLPCASLLFGDVFRAFNPWRAIGRFTGWAAGRVLSDQPPPLEYPTRLGRWPAAVGILAFVWVELGYTSRDDPSALAILALIYAVIQLAGMGVYGVEAWSARSDAFGVYFGLFARLSPLHWRRAELFTRPPLGGAPQLSPLPGTVALLCVMIGTTSFDGLSIGGLWRPLAGRIQDGVVAIGASEQIAFQLTTAVGLIAAVAFI